MINQIKRIYHNLPPSLRKLLSPVSFVASLVYSFRVELWLLTGKEKSSEDELVFLYAGNEWNKNYFANLAYDGSHSEKYLGTKWLWQIDIKRSYSDQPASMAVREIPASIRFLFQNKNDFRLPNMITVDMNIPENLPSFLDYHTAVSPLARNHSLRTDMRKILRNDYTYEVTQELSGLNDFFSSMYLPYIKKVHDDEAVYLAIEWIIRKFSPWEILFVKKGDKKLGGVLLNYRKNKYHLRISGLKDGNLQYLQDGVSGALYFFALCHAQEKGYRVAGLGGVRPFLKDGVLNFKKKWKPWVSGQYDRRFLLRVVSTTPGVKSFLVNNPFVYFEGSKLKGAVFIHDNQSAEDADINKILKQYFIEGLSGMCLFRITDTGISIKQEIQQFSRS